MKTRLNRISGDQIKTQIYKHITFTGNTILESVIIILPYGFSYTPFLCTDFLITYNILQTNTIRKTPFVRVFKLARVILKTPCSSSLKLRRVYTLKTCVLLLLTCSAHFQIIFFNDSYNGILINF